MTKSSFVGGREVSFGSDEEIISTTDLDGRITSYNDLFKMISGYDDDEMMGKNHNLIRHPDMPKLAFKDLWAHMKANKHWMGIVKNKTKTGDYYWVDAYITPTIEDGSIVGYESVRAKPSAERVERAKLVYAQLNKGKKPVIGNVMERLSIKKRGGFATAMSVITAIITQYLTPDLFPLMSQLSAVLSGLLIYFILSSWTFLPLTMALAKVHRDVNNPLMALIYTGRDDEIGQLMLSAEMLKGRLRTILSRIKDSVTRIEEDAERSEQSNQHINSSIRNQINETDLVASAMTEMTCTVQEVANHASLAAQKASDADKHSQLGVVHASGAAQGLEEISLAFENVANVVTRLEGDTKNIGAVLDVIKNVAEQTNLLALNAAIEAARAGEHGRGFAVVADEVRNLAAQTQNSATEINALIDKLNAAVNEAVTVMHNSKEASSSSTEKVFEAINILNHIATVVGEMNDVNMLIATSVEQQSAVSEDINKNISQISIGAETVMGIVDTATSAAARSLAMQSVKLKNMIDRFKAA